MKLTSTQIKAARHTGGAPRRLADGRGLCLVVHASGTKTWKLRTRGADGKQRDITLGQYPEVGLADAREIANTHRLAKAKAKSQGEDYKPVVEPSPKPEDPVYVPTFRDVAIRYVRHRTDWVAGHRARFVNRMENDVFPAIGCMLLDEIDVADLLAIANGIAARQANDTAHRVVQMIAQVIDYGRITAGIRRDNPARGLKLAMPKRPPAKHREAITDDPAMFGAFLRDLDNWPGTSIAVELIKFDALVFQRPGEIRNMRWDHVDWKGARWTFTASKVGREHIVPLSTQAVAQLQSLHKITGRTDYVFSSTAGKPMSNVLPSQMLKKLRWRDRQSAHGLRATARTMLVERLGFDRKWVETQLSHVTKETHGHAYDRAQFLEGRTQMMQTWADYLDGLRADPANKGVTIGAAR
jgi:integrase